MAVSSTIPTPPLRAGWTASGACTSGLTALPKAAMRRACGGAATTSTSLLRRLGAALRHQRGRDHCLVCVHVGDGRDADARRLVDVDGVDVDPWIYMARRRGDVSWHVDRDD